MSKLNDFVKVVESSVMKMIRQDLIPDSQYEEMLQFYEPYSVGITYSPKDLFTYEGELYEVVQGHTSQAGWNPDELPALYKKVVPEGVIPVWVQPLGAHDAYNLGDKVIFNDNIYESIVNNNVWPPNVYGWRLI